MKITKVNLLSKSFLASSCAHMNHRYLHSPQAIGTLIIYTVLINIIIQVSFNIEMNATGIIFRLVLILIGTCFLREKLHMRDFKSSYFLRKMFYKR